MADRSFGVKEINIVGTSAGVGTPTIESPTNLNLNASRVAISTDVHIGRNVNAVGIITAQSFIGDGSALTNISASSTPRWTLGSNGSSDYTFTGIGFTETTNDPVLYLARGQKYEFQNNAAGHPFEIRVSNSGVAYNNGVVNNAAGSGIVTFTVPFNAPNTLYYQCTFHSGMGNTIRVYPDLI